MRGLMLLPAFWLCVLPAPAHDSAMLEPVPVGNRSPLIAGLLAPQLVSIPHIGTHVWSSGLEVVNHSLIESQADELLVLDGETWRVDLAWAFRPSDRWVLHAALPWLSHSGGILDPAIDRWHELTGLPDGERDKQPRNVLNFLLQTADGNASADRSVSGLGDLTVGALYQWSATSSRQTWIYFDLKLPTGSAANFSGSEATDVAVSLAHRRAFAIGRRAAELATLTGVIHTGPYTGLKRLRRHQQAFAQVQLGAAINRIAVAELQFRWRSAAFRSSTDHLGAASLGVDAGLQWSTRYGIFKTGFSEDLLVDSAPDVGFYLRFIRRHHLSQ